MKTTLLFAFLLFLLPSLLAFDATAWANKKSAMAQEAVRMEKLYWTCLEKVDKPAENLTVPFEMFESGKVKSVVLAKHGKFFSGTGYVWAKDLVVEQYKEDGTLDMRMEASNCLVDRPHKCCWISGHVKAHHRKTTLEGCDAFYCSSNNYLRVMSNVKVVSEDVKMKGLKL